MAGNVGTQSLAVTIRVLMDDGVTFSQCVTLIWKEVKVGIAGGALLGAASVPVIGLYICLLKDMTPFYAFSVAGCVGLALVIAMTISSFAGTVIPVLPQNQSGSGRGLRPPDHHGQRPGGGNRLLRNCLVNAHPGVPPGLKKSIPR